MEFIAEYSEVDIRRMLVHNAEPALAPMVNAEGSLRASPKDDAAAGDCKSVPIVRSAKVPRLDTDPNKRFGNRITVFWPTDKKSFHGTVTKVRKSALRFHLRPCFILSAAGR